MVGTHIHVWLKVCACTCGRSTCDLRRCFSACRVTRHCSCDLRPATLLLSLSCDTTLLVTMQWALSAWAGNQERRIGWNGRLYTKEDIEEYYWPRTDIWDDLPHCAYQLSSYQQHLQSQSSASSQQQMPTWMTRTAAEDTHGWTRTAAGHWHRTIDASQPDAIDASQPDASRAINVVAPTTDSTIDSSQLALGSPEQPRTAQSSIEQTTSAHSSQEQPRPAPRHTPPVNPTVAPEIVPAQIVSARHLLSDGRNLRRRPVAQSIQNPPPPGPILEIQDMGAIRPIGVGPLLCHGISTGMWESVSDLCYVQSASAHVAPQHDRQETQETSPQGQLPVAAQSSQQQSLHPTTEANDAHVAACTTLSTIDAFQLDARQVLVAPAPALPGLQCPLCKRELCQAHSLCFFRRINPQGGVEVHLMLKPEAPVPPTFVRAPETEKGATQTWQCACGAKMGDTRPIGPSKASMTAFKSSSVMLHGQHHTAKKSMWPRIYDSPLFNDIQVRSRDSFHGI